MLIFQIHPFWKTSFLAILRAISLSDYFLSISECFRSGVGFVLFLIVCETVRGSCIVFLADEIGETGLGAICYV
jgi:hypothetical protein